MTIRGSIDGFGRTGRADLRVAAQAGVRAER